MDGVSETIFLNLLFSSMVVGRRGYLFCKRRRLQKKNQLFVVLSSRKSGITTQLKEVDNFNSNVIMVDVMENVVKSQRENDMNHLIKLSKENKEAYGLQVYPLVKNYITGLRNTYPQRPILLFTSDHSLVQYLKIDKRQVACLLPSMVLYQKLIKEFKEDDVELISESRERLIGMGYPIFFYNSFRHLKDKLNLFINKQ